MPKARRMLSAALLLHRRVDCASSLPELSRKLAMAPSVEWSARSIDGRFGLGFHKCWHALSSSRVVCDFLKVPVLCSALGLPKTRSYELGDGSLFVEVESSGVY